MNTLSAHDINRRNFLRTLAAAAAATTALGAASGEAAALHTTASKFDARQYNTWQRMAPVASVTVGEETATNALGLNWKILRTANPEGVHGLLGFRMTDGNNQLLLGPDAMPLAFSLEEFGLGPAVGEFAFTARNGSSRILGAVVVEPKHSAFEGADFPSTAYARLVGVFVRGDNLPAGSKYELRVTDGSTAFPLSRPLSLTANSRGRIRSFLGPFETNLRAKESLLTVSIKSVSLASGRAYLQYRNPLNTTKPMTQKLTMLAAAAHLPYKTDVTGTYVRPSADGLTTEERTWRLWVLNPEILPEGGLPESEVTGGAAVSFAVKVVDDAEVLSPYAVLSAPPVPGVGVQMKVAVGEQFVVD